MKKCFLKIIMGLMFVGSMLFSNYLNAQVEQGSIIIEPYYGISPTGKNAFVLHVNDARYTSHSFSTLGPTGLRFNFMISETFGIGIDGNYESIKFKSSDGGYKYTAKRNVIRAMVNFHLIFLSEGPFQLYGNAGGGYRHPVWKFTSEDPTYVEETPPGIKIPVALKLGAGFRYMFLDNMGIHVEGNYGGGSYANAGLTFAF